MAATILDLSRIIAAELPHHFYIILSAQHWVMNLYRSSAPWPPDIEAPSFASPVHTRFALQLYSF